MRRQRFLLDCDGVLADFVGAVIELCQRQLDLSFTHDQVTQWDVFEALGIKEHEHILERAIDFDAFCLSVPILGTAQEAVERIERDHGDVYVVTSPHHARGWVADRTEWLKKHFGLPKKRIVFTSAKHVVTGDYLLDDSDQNAREWKEHNPNGLAVVWNAPYNRESLTDCFVRVNDWDDFFKVIQ